MVSGVILKIDLNTGYGVCQIESRQISFNLLKLQDGNQSTIYSLKVGDKVYFDQEATLFEPINESYYLHDFSEKFEAVRVCYERSDRSPLVGDVVIANGKKTRLAKIEDDSVQFGPGKPYLYLEDCVASYSGSLDYPVSAHDLVDSGMMERVDFWTFKDTPSANNGIDFSVNVKVWIYKTV